MVFFIYKTFFKANSREPDVTPWSAASGLGLHCLPMSHKKDARCIWLVVYVVLDCIDS